MTAQQHHFSFPEVSIRVLSDHYTVSLRNIAVRLWQEEQYKKAGKRNYYTATVHVPASQRAKNSLVTFHFHVAAGALVILDSVTMQFLRGDGDTAHKDDAQLQVVLDDNTLKEVVFYYTTHLTGVPSQTYSSHLEQHESEPFFAYIEAEHQKKKNNTYHWMHLMTLPGEEQVTLISAASMRGEQIRNTFTYSKRRQTFQNTNNADDQITPEDYIDTLQSFLGMLPLNALY